MQVDEWQNYVNIRYSSEPKTTSSIFHLQIVGHKGTQVYYLSSDYINNITTTITYKKPVLQFSQQKLDNVSNWYSNYEGLKSI